MRVPLATQHNCLEGFREGFNKKLIIFYMSVIWGGAVLRTVLTIYYILKAPPPHLKTKFKKIKKE